MNQTLAEDTPDSPCTRICTLRADNICSGCFRHLSEIATWTALTAGERRRVLEAAAARRRAAIIAAG